MYINRNQLRTNDGTDKNNIMSTYDMEKYWVRK